MKASATYLLLAALAVLAPVKPMMIAASVLVLLDFVTGVWASVKTGNKGTSAKMSRTVTKKLVYHLSILSCFLMERFLTDDLLPLSKVCAGFIGLVEVKSVLENLNAINGSPVFSGLLDKLNGPNARKTPPEGTDAVRPPSQNRPDQAGP